MDDEEQRIALRRALDVASAAYTEAMRSYGLLQGTITAVHALAEANLDHLFSGDASDQGSGVTG